MDEFPFFVHALTQHSWKNQVISWQSRDASPDGIYFIIFFLELAAFGTKQVNRLYFFTQIFRKVGKSTTCMVFLCFLEMGSPLSLHTFIVKNQFELSSKFLLFRSKKKKNAIWQVWNGNGVSKIGKCHFILNFPCTNFLNSNLFGGWLMHLYLSPQHLILHRIRSF